MIKPWVWINCLHALWHFCWTLCLCDEVFPLSWAVVVMSETQSFPSCRSDWKVHWRGEKLWGLQGACGSGWERNQDADGHGGQERASWPGTCYLCGEVVATQDCQWRADTKLVLLDWSCCSECKLRHCGGVCLPLLVVGFCAITVWTFSCYKSTQTGLRFCFSWFGLVIIMHKFSIALFPAEQAQRACSHTCT